MPINSPDIFCYSIVVEPEASIESNDKFDSIGDIVPIAGVNCKTGFQSGILDEFPGASAGFSLRRLTKNYFGPLIKVQKQGGGTLDIGFDQDGNLDTASLLAFAGTGTCDIDTWYDQSGNGYNLTQPDTGKQPVIVNGGILKSANGKPCVDFNDSGQNHLLNTGELMTGAGMCHVLQTRCESFVVAGGFMSIIDQTGPDFGSAVLVDGDEKFGTFARFNSAFVSNNSSESAQTYSTVVSNFVSGGQSIRVNDVTDTGSTAFSGSGNTDRTFFMGGDSTIRDRFFDGIIQEYIFYNEAQTDLDGLRDNLNAYYNTF